MNFLKKIGIKVKMVLLAILGVAGFVLMLVIRGKVNPKDRMKYELARLDSELKIKELEADSEKKESELKEIQRQKDDIRKGIELIEKKEANNEEVDVEELDKFFSSRNF